MVSPEAVQSGTAQRPGSVELYKRGSSYRIPGQRVDGNDVLAAATWVGPPSDGLPLQRAAASPGKSVRRPATRPRDYLSSSWRSTYCRMPPWR